MRIKKKDKIFRLGNEAISSVLKESVDYYVCPICGNKYSSCTSLTFEHVPPRSQGGKELVLTCSTCNSQAGSSIDAHLSKRNLFERLEFNPSVPPKVLFEFEGFKVNAITTRKINQVTIKFSDKTNNPKAYTEFLARLSEMAKEGLGDGCEFSITPKAEYRPRLASISDLKSSFLIAFAKFGYRYALHENLYPVRQQIRNPEARILEFFSIVSKYEKKNDNRLALVEKPLSFLWVQLGRRIVFLPWIDSKSDFLDFLKDKYSLLKYHGVEIASPEKPEFCLDFK